MKSVCSARGRGKKDKFVLKSIAKTFLAVAIAGAMTLFMAAFSQNDDLTAEGAALAGGWNRAESPVVTAHMHNLMDRASEGLVGVTYEPEAFLGTQTVAGTNYRFLCRVRPMIPDTVSSYAVVTLYEDLRGGVQIREVLNSSTEAASEVMPGSWDRAVLPLVTGRAYEALALAAEEKEAESYEALALLGTHNTEGTNYALLCEETGSNEEESEFVVLHVYRDLKGTARITDSYTFT